jgi:hypothetical protein
MMIWIQFSIKTQIKEVTNIKFLGLGTEKNMEQNTDIEQTVAMLSTTAC